MIPTGKPSGLRRPRDSAGLKAMLDRADQRQAGNAALDRLAAVVAQVQGALRVQRIESQTKILTLQNQVQNLMAELGTRRVTDEPNRTKLPIPPATIAIPQDLLETTALFVEKDSETTVKVSAGKMKIVTLNFDVGGHYTSLGESFVALAAVTGIGSETYPYIYAWAGGAIAHQSSDELTENCAVCLAKLNYVDNVIDTIDRYRPGNPTVLKVDRAT